MTLFRQNLAQGTVAPGTEVDSLLVSRSSWYRSRRESSVRPDPAHRAAHRRRHAGAVPLPPGVGHASPDRHHSADPAPAEGEAGECLFQPLHSRRNVPTQAAGMWQRYYHRWHSVTLDQLDPAQIDVVHELKPWAKRAGDKPGYSALASAEIRAAALRRARRDPDRRRDRRMRAGDRDRSDGSGLARDPGRRCARPVPRCRAMPRRSTSCTTASTSRSRWQAWIRSWQPGNDRRARKAAGQRPRLEQLGQRMAGADEPAAARPHPDAGRLCFQQERLHRFPGAGRRRALRIALGARRADRAAPVACRHGVRPRLQPAGDRCPSAELVDGEARRVGPALLAVLDSCTGNRMQPSPRSNGATTKSPAN